jgi:hypothetical protein
MAKVPLQNMSQWSHWKTVEEASKTVSTWPEWKRERQLFSEECEEDSPEPAKSQEERLDFK